MYKFQVIRPWVRVKQWRRVEANEGEHYEEAIERRVRIQHVMTFMRATAALDNFIEPAGKLI